MSTPFFLSLGFALLLKAAAYLKIASGAITGHGGRGTISSSGANTVLSAVLGGLVVTV